MANRISSMKRLVLEIENVKLNIDLYDGFFGITEKKSGPHTHKEFEFHHVLSGSVKISSEEIEYITSQNETYIVAPNLLHSTMPLDTKTFKSSFCFSFSKTKRKSDFDLYEIFNSAFGSIDGILKVPITPEHNFFLNEIYSLFWSIICISTTFFIINSI